MYPEMDTQPDSDCAYPPDTVFSSSSTTNVGAQHRPRPPRSTAQHRQHPYTIPGRKALIQKLRGVHENSSFGADTGAGPLATDQRRSTDIIEPSLLTTPNVTPSTQPITTILIPDLTKLITRCSPDPISGGTYGNIYKCIYHGPEGDVEVAVKAIRPQFFSAESFRRELGIWKRLRHSNILKFMGTTSDFGDSVALVAPWMTNGTLTLFLDQNKETLGLHDRLLLLRDIAAGLNYLHTFSLTEDGHTDLNPVVHGDLTGTNVLIDGDGKAYLADFGLSGTFEKVVGMTYLAKLTCHPGALRWAAPELLSGEESTALATTQSDMYSFGNIMLQVLTGKVPWCHLTRDIQISYQVVIEGKMHPRPSNDYVTDQHWNFMTRCWSITITDRPPAKEAIQFVASALHLSTSLQSPSIFSDERNPGIARDKDAVRAESGCFTCRIRGKKCDEQRDINVGCQTCARLRLQCLGFGAEFPEWLRGREEVIREKITNFLNQEPSILSKKLDYCGYPSDTYTTSLTSQTQSNLPRPHTSDSSGTYHAYFPDEDNNNSVIPPGYPLPQPDYNNAIDYNRVNPNIQNTWLPYYMQHVLHIQYLHADGSINEIVWGLIHSSYSAREAACLLVDLHRKSTQGAFGFTAPAHSRIQSIPVVPVTEGDAFASLCMVSYFLFSGGQGQWQAFLDSACDFSIKVLQRNHTAPYWALKSCNKSMQFIIKTSIWFDVLASVTLIRRPKFLELLRALYGFIAVDDGSPELSMMAVMGCENHIVLALAEIADLACWEDECRRTGRFSIFELVKRSQRIETILKPTNHPDHPDIDTETTRRRRLTSDVFRASSLVYLYSVISDYIRCPKITTNIAETVECLRRAGGLSTARHVVRSVVFSICICGCLTDDPQYRDYFLRRLQEQQTETVGNCARVAQLMREVWSRRERGELVDWRVVMQQSQMLLV
ncbi:hypothetical protein CY34DRAFT_805433 [Suillus luteus UH-Slu-Lm8-n1]|uniref:Uncharacterized protein n=1 Tax=Suillus luteus UH-Slu-Lm8-n1 TaxID=930992 RepID=A0A0D0BFE7_9AGAM|nr:hypothetical protein CY34DRAFT_805433 [Suillus luteus UH-Slu-Lm8-n1]